MSNLPGRVRNRPAVPPETEALLKRRQRQVQEEFRTILYSIGDAVITSDKDGRVRQMNPVAERLTGRTEAEAQGQALGEVFRIVNEETRAAAENPVDRVLREGLVIGLANHTLLLSHDGTEWPIADSGAPIRDIKGKITGVVLIFRDQTQERAAQKALEESERKFRETIKYLDEGYYSCMMDGVILEHNQAFNRILGFDISKDMKGSKLPDFWQNPDERKAYLQELMTRGCIINYLISAKKFDGEKIVVMANAHLVKDENDKPARIVGTFTDFTERKLADEQLRKLNRIYTVLSDINQALVRTREPQEMFEKVCRIAVEQGGFIMAWIGLLDESSQKIQAVARAGKTEGYLEKIDISLAGEPLGYCPIDLALRRGQHIICNALEKEEMAPCQKRAHDLGFRSSVSLPLRVFDRIRGAVTLYAGEPDFFDEEEMKLLDELALDISYAMEFAEKEVERKRAQEALRQSEEKYHGLFQNAEVGMYRSRLDGTAILSVNRKLCEIFGYSEKEMLDNPATIRWADPGARDRMMTKLRQVGSLHDYEMDIITKGGEIRSLLISIQLYPGQGYIEGSAVDITERQREREALRASEERYRTTMMSVGDGVIGTDREGRVELLNPVAETMTGWRQGEARGKSLEEIFRIINEVTRQSVENPVRRVMREGLVVGLANHSVLIAKDGTEHPIADSGAPIRNEKGEISGVVLVFRDQTEERTTQKALRESEEKYRNLVENASIGIFRTKIDGSRVLDANPKLCEMLGLTREEFVGQPSAIAWAHPEQREVLVRLLREKGTVNNYEIDLRTKSGEIRTVIMSMITYPELGYLEGGMQDITDRKRAEEQLRNFGKDLEQKVEERTKELQRSKQILDETSRIARVGGWELDLRRNELSWTDVVKQIHEVGPEYQPTVETAINYYAPEAVPIISEAVRRAIEDGRSYDIELQLITAKQNRIWVRTVGQAYRVKGKIVRIGGVFQDINDRKTAENELKNYRDHLEQLVTERSAELVRSRELLVEAQTVARLGSWEWNAVKDEITGSEEFCRLFGVGQEQIAHFPQFIGLLHPDDRERVQQAVAETLEQNRPYDVDYRVFQPDGEWRHINARGRAYVDKKGKPLRMVGTCMDITERKKSEGMLRVYSERLQVVNQLDRVISSSNNIKDIYDTFVDQMHRLMEFDRTSIVLFDDSGEHWMPAMGWTRGTSFIPQGVPRQVRGSVIERLREEEKTLLEKEIGDYGEWPENQLLRQEGIHTRMIVPLKIQGAVRGFLTMASRNAGQYEERDVEVLQMVADQLAIALYKSELFDTVSQHAAELEDRVQKRTSQLESANKELEAFTYSVSHDLRAPLRHTSGYVELLAKQLQSDLSEKVQHYLSSIADSVRQMGVLIDDLLEFSKTGRAEMHESTLDMNRIVAEVSEQLRQDNSRRNIEWAIAQLPSVRGDNAMLRLVWDNLLGNAVKFTRTRKKAKIEIGFRQGDKEMIFFVHDNGVGFDMQYAQKLFGVFQRLHSTEEFEGTGIGLANVRRTIVRHGGRTWAEAELDKGATFYFSIPN